MEEIDVNDFVDMPIHRVKKKRVLSDKQKQNWARALETRRKNIEMRKKAKEEINKIEKEQLLNDPSLKQREKRLKELLLLMLSADEKAVVQQTNGEKRSPSKKQQIDEPTTEKIVIKRINNNEDRSELAYGIEKENDEERSELDYGIEKEGLSSEVKHYIPKTSSSSRTTLSSTSRRGTSPRRNINPLRPMSAESDDDENQVSIFRD